MNRLLPPPPPPLSEAEETGSPPQKKHKIDEEIGNTADSTVFSDDETSSPIIPTYSTYDSEEDYCPDYPAGKMDKALWERYYQQIEESEGFDIIDYPGGCWMTTIYPMPNVLNVPKYVHKLTDYAGKALKHYNDNYGTSYEVENIFKVNASGCRDFTYYITFSVKNGEHATFQAKVVEDLDDNLEFPIVRPKIVLMSSNVSAGKMPEERLSVPGRPTYSEPEDEQLRKDSFFIKNIEFTWVGKKFLLGVDDQGHCCCCWAFSATEAITVAHLKLKKELIPLSKQQLVDCMYSYYDKPPWFAKLTKNQCYPCSYNKAYKFAIEYGIVEETKYPFTEQRGECECPSEVKTVKIKAFQNVSELGLNKGLNKEGIKKLIKQQPITCAARHVSSLKEHRGKGVYMGPTKEDIEATKKLMEEGDVKVPMHAMLIVGYGTENGVDFYLVKNSWGKNWGYKGFAKIECGALSRLSYPIID